MLDYFLKFGVSMFVTLIREHTSPLANPCVNVEIKTAVEFADVLVRQV